MKKKKLQCSVPTLLLAGVLCLTLAACGAKQSSDMLASDTDSAASAALPVKAMNAKRVDENPYMAKSDANIHHDGYNTDSTDEVLPLGIYPEINVSYEKTNANASPAIYFDSYGHAVVPLLGGIAIRDLNAEETKTLGYFSPKQHDGGGYVIQSSYTFLDSENRIVCPTSNNQDFINRKAIKNTGQLPMYLIENHHEGIVSREKYDAVQAEMARRNAAKSPSKNAVTGMASYASKYALSERLVCGECGTLYRRCTWTRNGEKRVVWRCVSRLDYGKKYCHNSPTLDEAPLQQAILAVLNTAMADKNSLIRQITAAMETELIPFPGGTMSLGDIECRLRVLEQQFQTLLEKATDDPAAYGGQFKEILDEQTFLKEKRSVILANNNEQAKANQRIIDAAQTLENASPYITEWDESAVRQLVETVKILSKDEVAVTLKGGIEICQKIMY